MVLLTYFVSMVSPLKTNLASCENGRLECSGSTFLRGVGGLVQRSSPAALPRTVIRFSRTWRSDGVLLKRLYVLIYMELASRRIVWFAVTSRPEATWVVQQARNLVWELDDRPIPARLLIHDHDAKFPGSADCGVTYSSAGRLGVGSADRVPCGFRP